MFSEKDLSQFQQRGASLGTINEQIAYFKSGFPFLNITEPATVGKGVVRLSEAQVEQLSSDYEKAIASKQVLKFVPASGAASRMFKDLFSFMGNGSAEQLENPKNKAVKQFFQQLEKFAFYADLQAALPKGKTLKGMMEAGEYTDILRYLLTDDGLGYGNLPKGLLQFHQYGQQSRTPLEEHLVEGANYAKGQGGKVQLHFTVSPEHRQKFEEKLAQTRGIYEKAFGVSYQVGFSEQKLSTDTIAVEMDNSPFREEDGSILFRPGGHGALIENLNDISADVVFIKNIDNVVPDRIKGETYRYKKAIAGLLLQFQNRVFGYINALAQPTDALLNEVGAFLQNELCVFHSNYAGLSKEEKLRFCMTKLNRPIRVCGMVKNEGEPGGGPFLAVDPDGTIALQVVESAQIDMDDAGKKALVGQATHFNPVDLVCAMKDHQGKKFDLLRFRDPQTGFISYKSKDGRELKAQELPGLWNGAMSNWNTIFVEVPIITFNPVKTVNDLLRDQHQ
jgi:hypothetical protein